MLIPALALIAGLVLLVLSAQYFVDGSAACARRFGISPLLIGMVVVGFGTSAPELAVSVLSAWQGNPGIALGNAYGSNIFNIALILGLTALISPIAVQRQALYREIPILVVITLFSAWLLRDFSLSRADGLLMLALFAFIMGRTILGALRLRKQGQDVGAVDEATEATQGPEMSLFRALFYVVGGLVVLVLSSRLLVWGSVEIAHAFGVSDLIIGLTIVAAGTSLPELASSMVAAKKGENDIALGNILGSNFFNTLAVVGLAASISPMAVERAVMFRDMPLMLLVTLALFLVGWAPRGQEGRINRLEGGLLVAVYIGYTLLLLRAAGAF